MKQPTATRWTVDPDTGCWNWTGPTNRGYGKAHHEGRKMTAHRAVWMILRGPIPSGSDTHLDHLCRNTLCVNPDHMEIVSRRENILRGESPYARNARKTHCDHGHEFTPDNTRIRTDGRRRCRTCHRADSQRYRDSQRG
jgi:hypothetical protein